MARRPTHDQNRILNFIAYYFREHGYAPSVRDICAACDIPSTSTVAKYLDTLSGAGLIRRGRYRSRALSLTPAGHTAATERDDS